MIENIDIGGPTMIRAAAKNFAFARRGRQPGELRRRPAELRDTDGRLSLATRESLAAEAFAYTARYDTAIARWFAEREDDFPPLLVRAFEKVTDLSYGENPHQRAAYYAQVGARMHVLSMVRQLGGKELSFNNLLDLDAAPPAGRSEFELPACAIVKHNNPCGVAVGESVLEAYQARVRLRPDVGLRRRHLRQPPGRPRASPRRCRSSSRGAVRARLSTTRRWSCCRGKPNLRILEDGERRTPDSPSATSSR